MNWSIGRGLERWGWENGVEGKLRNRYKFFRCVWLRRGPWTILDVAVRCSPFGHYAYGTTHVFSSGFIRASNRADRLWIRWCQGRSCIGCASGSKNFF
jgi:hypothetical protein